MKIDIEAKYQQYLRLNKLSEDQMAPIQKIQIKRAFMGGVGMTMIAMRDEIGAIEDDQQAVKALDATLHDISNFWQDQNNAKG